MVGAIAAPVVGAFASKAAGKLFGDEGPAYAGGGEGFQQMANVVLIPDYLKKIIQGEGGIARSMSDFFRQPYEAFGGQRVAGFTPDQFTGFQGIRDLQDRYDPLRDLAQQTAIEGAAGLTPELIRSFGNMYQQDVTDIRKREARREADLQMQEILDMDKAIGAFGGDRTALAESELRRNVRQQLDDLQTMGLKEGLDFARQTGLASLAQKGQSAGLLSNLAQAGQASDLQGMQALLGIGGQQQLLDQAGLDVAYGDWMEQRDYPYTQAAKTADILYPLLGQQSTGTTNQSAYNPGITGGQMGAAVGTAIGSGIGGLFGGGAGGRTFGTPNQTWDFGDIFSAGARSDRDYAAAGGFGPYRFKEGGLVDKYKCGGHVKKYQGGGLLDYLGGMKDKATDAFMSIPAKEVGDIMNTDLYRFGFPEDVTVGRSILNNLLNVGEEARRIPYNIGRKGFGIPAAVEGIGDVLQSTPAEMAERNLMEEIGNLTYGDQQGIMRIAEGRPAKKTPEQESAEKLLNKVNELTKAETGKDLLPTRETITKPKEELEKDQPFGGMSPTMATTIGNILTPGQSPLASLGLGMKAYGAAAAAEKQAEIDSAIKQMNAETNRIIAETSKQTADAKAKLQPIEELLKQSSLEKKQLEIQKLLREAALGPAGQAMLESFKTNPKLMAMDPMELIELARSADLGSLSDEQLMAEIAKLEQ